MNAEPYLIVVAEALQEVGLDAVLVGNAAAALQGAPVTTLDLDFMFRMTPANVRKVKALGRRLNAVVFKPYFPASDMFRLAVEDTGLQLDFLSVLHAVRSFESLRSRAVAIRFGRAKLWVASLDDIIRSKKALGRPKDLAVLAILEKTARAKAKEGGEPKREA